MATKKQCEKVAEKYKAAIEKNTPDNRFVEILCNAPDFYIWEDSDSTQLVCIADLHFGEKTSDAYDLAIERMSEGIREMTKEEKIEFYGKETV